MSALQEFEALYRGERAVCSFAQARLEVAHWLCQSPFALDLDDEDAGWAVEATRSWFESGPSLPERGKIPDTTSSGVRELLKPKQGRTKAKESKVTPNRLWRKRSY